MPISPAAAPAQTHAKYERLIADAKQVPPATTIVVHPCDETSLRGAADAATARIIIPILVGPKAKIAAAARQHKVDISRFEIVDAAHT
jgi:phosphate acetyltransferase